LHGSPSFQRRYSGERWKRRNEGAAIIKGGAPPRRPQAGGEGARPFASSAAGW
ncbi:unnamed protein product, partial [Phaeothamnion confervicola]